MSRAVALQEKFANRYLRESCEIGIVHLGIGAFHRATRLGIPTSY